MRASSAWVWVVWIVAGLAGCGFFNTPYTADLSTRSINPPTLLVASPIERKLFIVVADGNVSDGFAIRNSPHSVRSFRSFLGGALRNTFRPYFRAVEVVAERPTPEQLAAAGPSAVADVRVDGVEARDLPVGQLVYTTLHLQWAFAVRPAEAGEYLFSFAGTGVSDHAYNTLEQGFEQMLLSAIGGLMQRWTEDEVFNAFRSAGGEAPAEPAPPQVL